MLKQQRVFAVNIPDSHLTDARTKAETGWVTPSGKKKKKKRSQVSHPGLAPKPVALTMTLPPDLAHDRLRLPGKPGQKSSTTLFQVLAI